MQKSMPCHINFIVNLQSSSNYTAWMQDQARTQGGFDGCAHEPPLFGTLIFNLQFWHSL